MKEHSVVKVVFLKGVGLGMLLEQVVVYDILEIALWEIFNVCFNALRHSLEEELELIEVVIDCVDLLAVDVLLDGVLVRLCVAGNLLVGTYDLYEECGKERSA